MKRNRMSFDLDDEQKQKIEELADDMHRSQASIIREAVELYIQTEVES